MSESKNKVQINLFIGNIVFLMLSFFYFPPMSPALTLLLAIFSLSFSKNKLNNFKQNWKFVLLFSAIFWVYLLGMIFTENMEKGWTAVILKFSFLAYPLIFALLDSSFIRKKQMHFLTGAFILITTSSALFSLGHAAFEYFVHHDHQAFFYARLSYLLHPSYYALYVNFALISVLCSLLVNKQIKRKASKILFWSLVPFYIVFLILLESKAGLLGLLSVIFLTLIHLVLYEKKYREALTLALLSLISVGFTILLIPQTTSRVNDVVENMENQKEDAAHHSASAARIYLWKAAFNAFKEKPITGYGSGDVSKELMHQYKLQNNTRALEMHYDSHNQYLQTAMATGILGLISLFFLVGFPVYFGFKRKILLFFLLGLLMSINIVVESMFERQAGVMFYAFFNSLLFFYYKSDL